MIELQPEEHKYLELMISLLFLLLFLLLTAIHNLNNLT